MDVPEDILAPKVTQTLILLSLHLNAITTYQKLYGRDMFGELPALWYQITRKYPALGRVREDSDIRFARRLCS